MARSSAGSGTRARTVFAWIAVVTVLLAAMLSGAWYYLASRLDSAVRDAVAVAARQGVAIACDNQTVFGYPFRLGLHCDGVGVDAPGQGFRANGGTLRTAAQIYDPTGVVAELDAPLILASPDGPPLDIRWDLAQASAHFWTEGLDRFSLVLEAPVFAVVQPAAGRQPLARSARLEAHARRRGDSLDIAFDDRAIVMLEPRLASLPAFDVVADLTIDNAAGWLSGQREGATLARSLAGKAGTIRTMRLALSAPGEGAASLASTAQAGAASAAPQAGAELSGPFRIAEDGRISGDFDVAVTEPEKLAALAGTLDPAIAAVAGTIASGVGLAGRNENGRTVIRLTVRDGNAAIGFIPLGEIPPLR